MVITQVETPSKFWLNLQQIGYFDSVMEDMYWLVIADQGMCCQLGIRLEGLPRSLVIRVVNSSIGPGEGGEETRDKLVEMVDTLEGDWWPISRQMLQGRK